MTKYGKEIIVVLLISVKSLGDKATTVLGRVEYLLKMF